MLHTKETLTLNQSNTRERNSHHEGVISDRQLMLVIIILCIVTTFVHHAISTDHASCCTQHSCNYRAIDIARYNPIYLVRHRRNVNSSISILPFDPGILRSHISTPSLNYEPRNIATTYIPSLYNDIHHDFRTAN